MSPQRFWLSLFFASCTAPPDPAPAASSHGDEGAVSGAWPVAPALELEHAEAGPMPASIEAQPAEHGWSVTFALASNVEGSQIHLAGSFNSWNAKSLPLERDADGRWRVTVDLPEGLHSYKFVVDGEHWIPDPDNDDHEPDGFKNVNSLLRLGALGRPGELKARVGDGEVVTAALEHDPRQLLYRQRSASGSILLRYRTLSGDVEGVTLVVRGGQRVPMRCVTDGGTFAFWEAALEDTAAPFTYGFLLEDGDLVATDPRSFTLDPSELAVFTTPEWTKHAVWYQILIERFRNGDPANDAPRVRSWTSDWQAPAEWEGHDGQTFYEYYVFQRMYGGDLAGVRQQLDYLQELGINALYFNPIFEAPGHHKYNATDFRHVDVGYGAGEDYHEATRDEDLLDPSTWVWTPSDRVFLDFLKECKARGLRVVLDGVFNHVGVLHPAFQDVLEKGRESRFADWFEVKSWEPFEYAGWAGFGELPVFAKTPDGFVSPAVKEHIFAITRRWMDPDGDGDPSDGIDGWRLDVPMEVAMPFWEEWRELVKSINPEAYIAGEVWDQAETWLDGKRFDAVMNYRFADAAVAWIGNVERKWSVTELDDRLARLRLAYPDEATSSLMDLLDSHDTDRAVSMMLNPDRSYDKQNREQEEGSTYDPRRPDEVHYRRLRLAVLLQMTYVGAPMVYYGDEVGMWGSDDPNNRKPMLWSDLQPYEGSEENRVDEDLLAYYRGAIDLRRRNEALRVGDFETLIADDDQDLWVFRRRLGDEQLVVALTAGGEGAHFELPPTPAGRAWRCVFDTHEGGADQETRVHGIGGRVWRAE